MKTDEVTVVPFRYFLKRICMKKDGQQSKCLEPVHPQSTLKDIVDFITERLPKTISHWN